MVDAPDGGRYRSEDGGASWTRASGELPRVEQAVQATLAAWATLEQQRSP